VALSGAEGGSNISGADFAHTIVEEIDNPGQQQPHVTDEAGPGGHARDQAADLRRRVHATVAARADLLRYQLVQPGPSPGARPARDQGRIVERGASPRADMRQSHSKGVLSNRAGRA
jgi:hypothetical protein